jgi:hypothetical protein
LGPALAFALGFLPLFFFPGGAPFFPGVTCDRGEGGGDESNQMSCVCSQKHPAAHMFF